MCRPPPASGVAVLDAELALTETFASSSMSRWWCRLDAHALGLPA